jgi:restriction endonuclease S subunit
MAIAANWQALNKAEQKAQLESAIAAILDSLEAQSAPPTDWQKAKVIDAIDATTRGLFDVA